MPVPEAAAAEVEAEAEACILVAVAVAEDDDNFFFLTLRYLANLTDFCINEAQKSLAKFSISSSALSSRVYIPDGSMDCIRVDNLGPRSVEGLGFKGLEEAVLVVVVGAEVEADVEEDALVVEDLDDVVVRCFLADEDEVTLDGVAFVVLVVGVVVVVVLLVVEFDVDVVPPVLVEPFGLLLVPGVRGVPEVPLVPPVPPAPAPDPDPVVAAAVLTLAFVIAVPVPVAVPVDDGTD